MTSPDDVCVDIVVNNHNYGRFVDQAVNSAIRQDHSKVSVIVVDDGSSDSSPRVLSKYAEDVDLVFKENGGQASALNAGLARCHGDVVILLDADDVLDPNAAGMAAAAFAADPVAARLQFRILPVDADGRDLGRMPGAVAQVRSAGGDLRAAELLSPFEMPTVPTSANAFRRSTIEQILPIPEDRCRGCADYYLVHLSTLLGHVIYRPEIGARYRIHGANAFQPAQPVLDLSRLHLEIEYQLTTLDYLSKLGDQLSLDYQRPILSMSNLTLRVISRKLDASAHPVSSDQSVALLLAAVKSARRRRDLSLAVRLRQIVALTAISLSPRWLATRLAELVVFPELRSRVWLSGPFLSWRSTGRGNT